MSTNSTARLQLVKVVPDSNEPWNKGQHFNDNMDKIDAGIPPTICTSGTKPGSPFDGQLIWQTDIRALAIRNLLTTSWIQLAPELVGGHRRTTDDANTTATTEKLCCTLTNPAPLVQSNTYLIGGYTAFGGNTNDDLFLIRLRENNISGTILHTIGTTQVKTAGGLQQDLVWGFYTPGADENKNFAITLQRNSGTGVGGAKIGTALLVYRLAYSGLITTG